MVPRKTGTHLLDGLGTLLALFTYENNVTNFYVYHQSTIDAPWPTNAIVNRPLHTNVMLNIVQYMKHIWYARHFGVGYTVISDDDIITLKLSFYLFLFKTCGEDWDRIGGLLKYMHA
jgi:hypothetical protein